MLFLSSVIKIQSKHSSSGQANKFIATSNHVPTVQLGLFTYAASVNNLCGSFQFLLFFFNICQSVNNLVLLFAASFRFSSYFKNIFSCAQALHYISLKKATLSDMPTVLHPVLSQTITKLFNVILL